MKYPYYIVPDVEEYKKLEPTSEEAKRLSRRIAANIGDYVSLRLVLGIDPPEFARFYPDMDTYTPGTFDTIDTFLDKFGAPLPPLGYMASQVQEEGKKEEKSEKTEVVRAQEDSGSRPAEMIKELITHHRYDEAIQLIEAQNLNNPNKSIYFAHQMRFLRKLKALYKFKNQTQG